MAFLSILYQNQAPFQHMGLALFNECWHPQHLDNFGLIMSAELNAMIPHTATVKTD